MGVAPIARLSIYLFALVLLSARAVSLASERDEGRGPDSWPQWRGPNRDSVSTQTISTWPPVKLWQTTVGLGVSSVIVHGGRAFAAGHREGRDLVSAFDAATGQLRWQESYPARSDQTSDVTLPGPRSTPATDGERLFVMSLEGRLRCLSVETGRLLWSKTPQELGAEIGQYGICSSPLLHGNVLVCDLNKVCIALDKSTGLELWRAPGGGGWNGAGPVVVRTDHSEYIVYGTGRCVRADTGAHVFTVPYNEWSVVTPVVSGDRVFLAPFHGRNLGGRECAVIQIRNEAPVEIWKNDEVRALCSSAVLYEGHLYAADRDDISIAGENGRKMCVKCLDFANGKVTWVRRPVPWPTFLVLGDKLLIQTLTGELILAEASPVAYQELSRTQVLSGKCWAVPAVAGGRLYCRNVEGDLVCLDIGSGQGIRQPPTVTHSVSGSADRSPVIEDVPGFASVKDEAGENWPQFRGPGGSGVATSPVRRMHWNGQTSEGIRWKTRVPLPGASSPVVWGDRVFLSGGTQDRRVLYCFHAATGKPLWELAVDTVTSGSAVTEKVWSDGSYAAPTPCTDGRYIGVAFANGDVACVDFEGRLVWSRSLGVPVNAYGHASSPVIWQEFLILQLDQGLAAEGKSRLLALDLRSGTTVWETKRLVGATWSTPAVITAAGRTQVVACGVPWITSYDPGTGTEFWRAECMKNGLWAAPSLAFAPGVLFAVVEDAALAAIRLDGRGDVTQTHVAWTARDDLPSVCSPVCHAGLVFTLASGGILTCYRGTDGARLWQTDYSRDDVVFEASPVIAGDRLYLNDSSGRTFIMKAASRFEEVGRGELGEPCGGASPAFKNGQLYLRGATHLFCIGPDNFDS